jgi:hypothetical protein
MLAPNACAQTKSFAPVQPAAVLPLLGFILVGIGPLPLCNLLTNELLTALLDKQRCGTQERDDKLAAAHTLTLQHAQHTLHKPEE